MRWDMAATDVTPSDVRRGARTRSLIIAGTTSSGSFHGGSRSVERIAKEHSVCV